MLKIQQIVQPFFGAPEKLNEEMRVSDDEIVQPFYYSTSSTVVLQIAGVQMYY